MEDNSAQQGVEGVTAQDVLQQSEGIENVEAQATTEEVQPEAENAETTQAVESVEDKNFAKKFAALSRKEKQIRERESELEQRFAQLESQMADMKKANEPQPEPELPLDVRLRNDPMKTLESMGLDFETLSQIMLNDGKLPADMQMKLMQEKSESSLREELNSLRSEIEERDRKAAEEKHNQTITGFKNQITSEVTKNKAEYELLAAEGEEGTDLVYDVIEEYYNDNGEVMNIKEAAALVEDYLLEEAKKRIGLSKIQKLVGASETPAEKPTEQQNNNSVTLSNSQSQVATPGERFMSDDESKQSAAKLIRWIED